MSHSEERKEKDCLNCGTIVQGRYCQQCGQENIEPRHSVWHLITHFFYDITHFDGKFFTTLKDLLYRPGFLSREYRKGRRQSYLDPVRLYIFTSAIFFIVFFWLYNPDHLNTDDIKFTVASVDEKREEALKQSKTHEDSVAIQSAFSYVDPAAVAARADTTTPRLGRAFGSKANQRQFSSVKEYDSIQTALPARYHDNWLVRGFFHQAIGLNQKYRNDSENFTRGWLRALFHSLPKLMFISLPLFALLLQILFVRRRTQYSYVDHGIFSIHLYVYTFFAFMALLIVSDLRQRWGWSWLWVVSVAIVLFSLIYYFRAMRFFYQQRFFKTAVKYILVLVGSLAMIVLLFLFFSVYSLFEL